MKGYVDKDQTTNLMIIYSLDGRSDNTLGILSLKVGPVEGAHEGGGRVVLKYSEFKLNLSEFKLKISEF